MYGGENLLNAFCIVDLTAQGFPCTLQNWIMRVLLSILTLGQKYIFIQGPFM